MRQLDESIGRVVRAVSEMKIENETLILVRILFSLSLSLSLTHSELFPQITGDNGAPTDQCDFFGGLNAPFNGEREYLHDSYNGAGGVGKTTTWEEGIENPSRSLPRVVLQSRITIESVSKCSGYSSHNRFLV